MTEYYFKTNIYRLHITIKHATLLTGSAYEILKIEITNNHHNF
jgi:hypothetical protein